MEEKASVWDLFSNRPDLPEEDDSKHIQNKKVKPSSSKTDTIWLKSLVHPTAEYNFTKLAVQELISTSNQQIICKIKVNQSHYPEYTSILGFFSVWWWRESLDKLDFDTLKNLVKSFPFLERIRRNDQLILNNSLDFYLLVNEAKVIPNETDPSVGLLTSKRFLVIDWRDDD